MASSKIQFYKNGPDNQKRCDVTMDLRRPDTKKIAKWNLMQKMNLSQVADHMEIQAKIFIKELRKATTS